MADRPQPHGRHVPDGYELTAVAESTLGSGLEWRVPDGKPCRNLTSRVRCGRPSVAEMNRHRRYDGLTADAWWAYCENHLYGRWVEDGQVMCWILREKVPGA